jgi:ribonuclease R
MSKNKQTIKNELKDKITNLFAQNIKAQYNHKQIAKALGNYGLEHKKYVLPALYKLCSEQILIEVTKGKFKISPKYLAKQKTFGPFIIGTVDMKQTGKAYISTEEALEDILIKSNNTNKALHNDKVKVRLFPKRNNQKLEGEIIEIIERKQTTYVGTFKTNKNFAFVLPDSKSMPQDIFISKDDFNNAKDGQKVVAEITDWPENANNPFGRVTRVLGDPGVNEVEISAILEQYGLPVLFPEKVVSNATNLSDKISNDEIKKRKDFRDVVTLTIDPVDAKDFDDALSLRKDDKGNWEIGVHIADVSHYVTPDSDIDNEAYARATSIYLVDRVIPMLPEVLSNGLCSLRPNEEKLTFSVVFTFNDTFKLLDTWIGKTIINSNRRFIYEDVQTIIESGEGEYKDEIKTLHEVAQNLREKRFKNGAISFDKKEIKFRLDENSKPIEAYVVVNNESHQLVEEFMLLANKTVAEFIGNPKKPILPKTFIYRIHDIPNPEKLQAFKEFVAKFGYHLKTDKRIDISKSLNSLLEEIQGKGEENLISSLAIRTMAKAEYSVSNIGHYGLGFDYYSHFTSPIRRYPDLMAHRLLYEYLNGANSFPSAIYEEKCKHSSDMEKLAQEAERDSIFYKQIEFLSTKVGLEFEGIISGVSKWGIYVELKENKCEGIVRLSDLSDDFYYLDEVNYQVVGQNKKQKYKLGDTVNIVIKKADIYNKVLEFGII